MSVPKFLKTSLWSYDLNSLNKEKDKHLIIEQILNFGSDKQIKWLAKNYNLKDIKKVVSNPSRGIWPESSLNYWTKVLGIKLKDWQYKLAVLDINPSAEKQKLLSKYVFKDS